jgi:HTH-type transcriptional regulator / antitoxin HipB
MPTMDTYAVREPTVPIRDAAVLGRLIRQVRKQQGLTLETLAGLCGLSIRFLSELENGRETCSLVRVLRVLDALGIELAARLPEELEP